MWLISMITNGNYYLPWEAARTRLSVWPISNPQFSRVTWKLFYVLDTFCSVFSNVIQNIKRCWISLTAYFYFRFVSNIGICITGLFGMGERSIDFGLSFHKGHWYVYIFSFRWAHVEQMEMAPFSPGVPNRFYLYQARVAADCILYT